MSSLARTFPALRHADGITPFDAKALDAWASGPRSHGEVCTAQFLLAVWGNTTLKECPWTCGPFDVMEALGVWDDAQRAAFLAWAQDPWWP